MTNLNSDNTPSPAFNHQSIPFLPVTFALIAFAANSLFCRLALAEGLIDAASFTTIRLLSGSIILLLLPVKNHAIKDTLQSGSWRAALALFTYAAAFSFAYVQLDTATGALVLFASVQFGLIGWSIVTGKQLLKLEWCGVAIAFSGFCVLVLPHANLQAGLAVVLMMLAGLSWSHYTLSGKGSAAPLADTRANFVRTTPMTLLLITLAYFFPETFGIAQLTVTFTGALWAMASGIVASGLGYALWYAVLPSISATQAAVLQLLVPVIAGFGGIIWLNEPLTSALIMACLLILGGIYLVLKARG